MITVVYLISCVLIGTTVESRNKFLNFSTIRAIVLFTLITILRMIAEQG